MNNTQPTAPQATAYFVGSLTVSETAPGKVEFFKVTERQGCTATLQPMTHIFVSGREAITGKLAPFALDKTRKPITRRLLIVDGVEQGFYRDEEAKQGLISLWDGKPRPGFYQ